MKKLLKTLKYCRSAILAVIEGSLQLRPEVKTAINTDYGRQVFYRTLKGAAVVPLNVMMLFSLPANHPYWQEVWQSKNLITRKLWMQGAAGVLMYRGKLQSGKTLRRSFRGRGISDAGSESAALITNADNVYCWARFRGFLITNFEREVVLGC